MAVWIVTMIIVVDRKVLPFFYYNLNESIK